jgi:hypothetical protein
VEVRQARRHLSNQLHGIFDEQQTKTMQDIFTHVQDDNRSQRQSQGEDNDYDFFSVSHIDDGSENARRLALHNAYILRRNSEIARKVCRRITE